MNNIAFFEGHEVEVFEFNGQILFNPYHVGNCLELSPEGVRKAITKMNENQVIKLKNSDVTNCHIRKLNNAGENFLLVSGIYKLAFKSHKSNAEKFTDWIADEVLPSIAENGYYISTEKDDKWLITRQETKEARNQETDKIKEFVEFATENGSSHASMYYKHFTDLVHKKCGIKTGERDKADQKTLLRLKSLETLIEMRLETLLQDNSLSYKDIYQSIKNLIETI